MQGLAISFYIKQYEKKFGRQIHSVEDCYGKPVDENEFFQKLKTVNFAQNLKSDLIALWEKRYYLSTETRIYLLAAVAYFIFPVDAVPEVVFGPLGYTDDVSVLVKCAECAFNDLYWTND